ncbi:GNAT family N-acetyltransferase [Paludibacterium paludis]|uniref:GCN5 family N-acetyltransferase n=1 Tax=Paludibacterium paludis TaxID=1225769 RepID=A0A918P4Z1_9NEIS|nr:N-acetyltransferase [Paludibacterium paludis]GGY19855.1 GCN5 family N-acetyltransferase [Paludibacterium paludis]
MTILIRLEQPQDGADIFELTRTAFLTAPHTSHTEQFIVDALRRRGELALSLVAQDDAHLVGHVAVSVVSLSSGCVGWYGVGPLSVLPGRQRQGVGSRLMRQALTLMEARGAAGCVLVGDPDYYSRFGFAPHPDLASPGIPSGYVLALAFGEDRPRGTVTFSGAFDASV